MAIHASDVADMLVAGKKAQHRNELTNLMEDLYEYYALPRILRQEVIKYTSGTGHLVHTLMDDDDNARNVGMFAVDNINQKDGLKDGDVPYRITTTGLTFDVKQISQMTGVEQVLNFHDVKRMQMWSGYAKRMETNWWIGPTNSADDVTPFGLFRYWLAYNATTGFNGGNNSNFSSGPANVNCDDFPKWNHFTFNYTAVTRNDLVKKVRNAMKQTGFKSPLPRTFIKEQARTPRQRHEMFTTWDSMLETMEELLEDRNENLGVDLAKFMGEVVFKRIPVFDVPQLSEVYPNSRPILGMDWKYVEIAAEKSSFLAETRPHQAALQHTVVQQELDSSWNPVITNRRQLFVGAITDWLTTP